MVFDVDLFVSDDYNRVVLDPIQGEHDSDYVNASYVDVSLVGRLIKIAACNAEHKFLLQSLLKPNAYIVTQGPTEETVIDFWRLVWHEKASCIVMLTKTFDFIKVIDFTTKRVMAILFVFVFR